MANRMQWPLNSMSFPELATAPLLEAEERESHRGDLAVMLTGGGARAAYQVGQLCGIARHFPNLRIQVISGVSAGAINAIYLAAMPGSLHERAEGLRGVWCDLECDHIYQLNFRSLIPFRSALASIFPRHRWSRPHGFVDTGPLAALLHRVLDTNGGPIRGVERNIASGDLHAIALTGLEYSTGQTVRWVQGHNIDIFEGPSRRSSPAKLTVNHVMASAALPFVFPAIRVGSEWYGDGGIRLAAPLSAAVHLGAARIIAMSTGHQRSPEEALHPNVRGYPPAAQIISQLVNAVFLDVIDEDVARMQRMNEMIRKMPPGERNGFRPIDLLVLRPSIDLGVLAAEYEKYLPRKIKLITRALGARETESPDFVSLLMFEPHYMKRLIALGEHDIESRLDELRVFLGEDARQISAV